MQTAESVDRMMQRTQALWYEDGLADLTMGGYFSAIGLLLLAQAATPPSSPLSLLWAIGTPLVLILGGVAAGWSLKRLKARLSVPRTGYVSFERAARGRSGIGRLLLLVVVSAGVSVGVVVASGRLNNLSVVFGLIGFGTFVYLWQRLGLVRYLALGLFNAIAGLALALTPLSMDQGGAVFWLLMGAALMVIGAVAWSRFSRAVPPAAAEESYAPQD